MSSLGDSCFGQLLWQPSLYICYVPPLLTWMAFFVSSKWRRDLTVGSTLRNLSSKRPNAFSQPCKLFSKLSQCSANCCRCSRRCSKLRTRSCHSRFNAALSCSISWRLRASAWRMSDCACWFTSPRSLFWLCSNNRNNGNSERERDRGRDKMSQSVRDVIKNGCKCGWGWIERG